MNLRPLTAEDIEVTRVWKNNDEPFARFHARLKISSQVNCFGKVSPDVYENHNAAFQARVGCALEAKLQQFLQKFNPFFGKDGEK